MKNCRRTLLAILLFAGFCKASVSEDISGMVKTLKNFIKNAQEAINKNAAEIADLRVSIEALQKKAHEQAQYEESSLLPLMSPTSCLSRAILEKEKRLKALLFADTVRLVAQKKQGRSLGRFLLSLEKELSASSPEEKMLALQHVKGVVDDFIAPQKGHVKSALAGAAGLLGLQAVLYAWHTLFKKSNNEQPAAEAVKN